MDRRDKKALQTKLLRDSISRRHMLVGAAAGGAALTLPGLGWQGARAATPKQGGLFRIGVSSGATTDSLDPATHTNPMMTLTAYCIANHLTEISPTGELIPELAESIEPSADARSWRFKLRKGIEFHNGKTLTAHDVVASYRHHMGEDSKSGAKASVSQIESFKIENDHEVVFELKSGNADFPYLCSDYHLVILPSEDGKMLWQDGVGTGPYMLKSFEAGAHASFTRNPNYWKSDRGHFDGVELIAILDPVSRQNAVVTGEADAVDTIEPRTAHLLEQVDDVRVLEVPSRLHYSWPMRVEAPPFDNLDFRLAIKHALDREELLEKVFFSRGGVGNDHPLSPVYKFYATLPQREQDFDKARYHLKKSGLGSNVSVDLSASDGAYPGAVDSAVLMREQLANVGIDVNVVREPKDGYWSNVWRKKPWCACWWYGRPTADWMFSDAYSAGSAYNDTGWNHERFNKLLVEARAELDQARRAEIYGELQLIVRDEGATPVTSFANHIMGLRDTVRHGEAVSGRYSLDGGKAVERWWFA